MFAFFRLAEYDACAQLGQEVMEKINERGRQQKNSANYAKVYYTYIHSYLSTWQDLSQDLETGSQIWQFEEWVFSVFCYMALISAWNRWKISAR